MAKRVFTRKKVKSLTLGERLRQLREDRRFRVQDLARKINVKPIYIEALENGRYDDLPIKVYTKGFVRSYSRFFDVSEETLFNLFEREYSVYQNIYHKDIEEEVNRLPKVPRFVFTPRVIISFIAFFVFIAVGLYLYFGVSNFISSPWLIIEEPSDNSIINSDSVLVRGKTRSSSRVLINGQQTFVDMDGVFTQKVGLAQGVNLINIKSINQFEKESTENITINALYDIPEEDVLQKNNVHITVRVDEKPAWINVIADDIDIYNETLEVDNERTFDAREHIILTTSSGKHTFVRTSENEKFSAVGDEDDIVRDILFDGNEDVIDVE